MIEFYVDEHPKKDDESGGGSWGGSGSGGGGGSGGGSGGGGAWGGSPGGVGNGTIGEDGIDGEPSIKEEVEIWHLLGSWRKSQSKILCDGSGKILKMGLYLLRGREACRDIKIYVQIQGDDGGTHVRCILLKTTLKNQKNSGIFSGFPAAIGMIDARWQSGHYDYSAIHAVRFKIWDVVSPWYELKLDEYIRIAMVAVNSTAQPIVWTA